MSIPKFPIFHGRWQPIHKGQMWLIKKVVEEFDSLVLGIVNPDPLHPPDPRFDRFPLSLNPFNYWERLVMLTDALRAENILEKVVIVPLWHPRVPPLLKEGKEEEAFLPPKRWRFHIVPMLSVEEEKKTLDLRAQGEEVRTIEDIPDEVYQYNETRIRKSIFKGDSSWEDMIPKPVVQRIKEFHGIERIKILYGHTRGVITGEDIRLYENLFESEKEGYSIFAGRFQPFHNGHLWVIKKMVERDKGVIGIVNPDPSHPPDTQYPLFKRPFNPFNFWERTMMIREVLKKEKLLDCMYIVPLWHPRAGIETDRAFLPTMRTWVIPNQPSDLSRINDLMTIGERVDNLILPRDIASIQEDTIRALMCSGRSWDQFVPPGVTKWIRAFGGEVRVKDLYATYGLTDETGAVLSQNISEKRHTRNTDALGLPKAKSRAVKDILEGILSLSSGGKLTRQNPCTKIEIVRKCGVARQTFEDRLENVKEVLEKQYGIELVIETCEGKKERIVFLKSVGKS